MKLLFVCASLRPGHDGVGDYVHRLATACGARGHGCTIIALHDPHVDIASDATHGALRLIRLPAAQPWSERIAAVHTDLRRIAPDWVSWQFVAYGFHPRGFLPAVLLENAGALRGSRCHVMMHELWLGLERGARLRDRGLGWLQRRGVVCWLDGLDPDLVHTSNVTYAEVLRREGYETGVLGLFGNVAVAEPNHDAASPFAPWLHVGVRPGERPPLIGVTFGTLHPQWRPGATIDWWHATARRLGRAPALLAVGRTGDQASAHLTRFRESGIQVAETGERDAANVSHLLAAADFGVAPHPWALIGKSGAAAAMLDHGLPVLVPRNEWTLRGAHSPPTSERNPLLARLAGLDADGTDRWLAARHPGRPALPGTTTAFLQALESAPLRS